MDARAFRWLPRAGHAPGALVPAGTRLPKPLAAQALDGARLAWVPLARGAAAARALAGLPGLPLFPARPEDVPAVVDAWLRLYEEAPAGMDEARLQVVDEPRRLLPYLAAEEALWARIYAAHPHRDEPGLYPRALEEARWLADAVLGDKAYDERAEFLTLEAMEGVARALLLTVRRSELLHLRDHLRGVEGFMGW